MRTLALNNDTHIFLLEFPKALFWSWVAFLFYSAFEFLHNYFKNACIFKLVFPPPSLLTIVPFCFGVHCMNACFNRIRKGSVQAEKHTLSPWASRKIQIKESESLEEGHLLRYRHSLFLSTQEFLSAGWHLWLSFRTGPSYPSGKISLASVSWHPLIECIIEDKVCTPGTLQRDISRMTIFINLIDTF